MPRLLLNEVFWLRNEMRKVSTIELNLLTSPFKLILHHSCKIECERNTSLTLSPLICSREFLPGHLKCSLQIGRVVRSNLRFLVRVTDIKIRHRPLRWWGCPSLFHLQRLSSINHHLIRKIRLMKWHWLVDLRSMRKRLSLT